MTYPEGPGTVDPKAVLEACSVLLTVAEGLNHLGKVEATALCLQMQIVAASLAKLAYHQGRGCTWIQSLTEVADATRKAV